MIGERLKWIGVVFIMTACDGDFRNEEGLYFFSQQYNFNSETHGWTGDFADYPVEDSLAYELVFDHVSLPQGLGSEKALILSGNNLDDNLFLFVKNKIIHLRPNSEYTISFEVEFVSNATRGAGGSPGHSAYLKAGASGEEPKKIPVYDIYRMNIDKGLQSTRGQDMVILGDVTTLNDSPAFTTDKRSNAIQFSATTNSKGELWLIIGIDSTCKGPTTFYLRQITALLSQSDN